MNSLNKKNSKNKERLESIKKVRAHENSKFTSRMEDYLEVISELIDIKKIRLTQLTDKLKI